MATGPEHERAAEERSFHLGDILSVTTGYLVSPRRMDALYDLLGFMTGDTLFTHQLPRACDECAPVLLEQHPQLREVAVPEQFDGAEHVERWLAEQVARFGETFPVAPLADGDHVHIDPLVELVAMAPHAGIIAVELSGEVTSQ